MIDVGPFLVAWVKTQSDLTSLLTFDGKLAVQPSALGPGNFARSVTYQMISHDPIRSLKSRPRGTFRVQLDCVSRVRSEAQDIASKIIGTDTSKRLDQYTGTLGGLTVQPALLMDQRDDYLEPIDAQSQGWHRVILDFSLWVSV